MGSGFLVEQRGKIVWITLDHPERANALDPAELHALAAMLRGLAGDSAQAVVLTGRGERAFCSGLNLRDAAAIRQDLSSQGPTGLGAVLRAAAVLPVPLIGRINGACVAGGMGLLGACDYAIASTQAGFGLPEINHGIVPHVAMAALHDRGAPGVVRRLAEGGNLIDAQAALDAGLVEELSPLADLDSKLADLLERVLAGPALPRFVARRDGGGAAIETRIAAAEAQARASVQAVNC